MEKKPYEEIIDFLKSKEADYKLYKHKSVITSEEAKEIKETDAVGLKSLLFKTEKGLILLVLPGDKRVSSKKVRSFLKVKDIRMVTPDEVLSVMGCQIGGCYPIGSVCGLRTIVDESTLEADSVVFNIGRRDRSIELSIDEFKRVVFFETADIS